MKYSSILTLVAFLVVSAGSAFAQQDIEASANVVGALEIDDAASENLAFGDVVEGQEYVIDVLGGNNSAALDNYNVGRIAVRSGLGQQEVIFNNTAGITGSEITLTGQTGESNENESITITNVEHATTATLGNDTGDEYTLGNTVALNDGDLDLLVGGTLNLSTETPTEGLYDATLTYTVELDM